jgi:hypothetical protein
VKHSDLVRTAARLMEAREPFMVIGPPGGGKTEGLLQAAEIALGQRKGDTLAGTHTQAKDGVHIIVTHPVISEEVDYRGLPGFVKGAHDELRAVFMPFGFLRTIVETDEPTVVIIDDVGQARLSVQAALMQMVQLREIDGNRVSDTVTFALASNRREDRAAVQGMVSALLDRCVCVLTLEVDADELARWLIANGYPTILAAFVRFRPASIRFDAKSEFEKSSTPRSIAGLGRLLNMGLDAHELVSGAVGPAFASEFLAYRKVEAALVPFEKILAEPTKVKVPEEKDVLYAVAAGLAGRLDEKNLSQGILYLERIPAEFAVMVMKDVAAKVPNVQLVPAFVKWARANAKLLGV